MKKAPFLLIIFLNHLPLLATLGDESTVSRATPPFEQLSDQYIKQLTIQAFNFANRKKLCTVSQILANETECPWEEKANAVMIIQQIQDDIHRTAQNLIKKTYSKSTSKLLIKVVNQSEEFSQEIFKKIFFPDR